MCQSACRVRTLVSTHPCRPHGESRESHLTSILERLAHGDESAADDCVSAYGGLVWRLSRRYLDHARSEVDDAVQDVFVEVWLHAKRFDPSKGSEAAFIATIAHRRLTDRQRRIRARNRSVNNYAEELNSLKNRSGSRNEVTTPDPARNTADQTYREVLEQAFRALPEDERNALWLSVYRGLSHREIGEALDTPVGTVKSRIRRAMIRLTKHIAPKLDHATREGGPA